jgi:hypothetical protein
MRPDGGVVDEAAVGLVGDEEGDAEAAVAEKLR